MKVTGISAYSFGGGGIIISASDGSTARLPLTEEQNTRVIALAEQIMEERGLPFTKGITND